MGQHHCNCIVPAATIYRHCMARPRNVLYEQRSHRVLLAYATTERSYVPCERGNACGTIDAYIKDCSKQIYKVRVITKEGD